MMVPALASAAQLRQVMEEHGVCLVTGVLSQAECNLMEELWTEDLKQLLPEKAERGTPKKLAAQLAKVRSENCSQWPAAWDEGLGFKGMASQRGTPHGAFAWAARLHPSVRRIFEDLHQEQDLCVGHDNVFWASSESTAAASNKEWLHVDQNHNTGMTWQCFQSVLYVWPSTGEAASTTVVCPGSHREVYDTMMQDPTALQGRAGVKLSEMREVGTLATLKTDALASARRMPCPAGSLLLWDSRTLHQGWAGGPRLAVPVCWEPRKRRDVAALMRKTWMCIAGVPSSHSAVEGRVHAMLKRRPTPKLETRDAPAMPAMPASIVPFGIAPGREDAWASAQDAIWCAAEHENVRRSADQLSKRLAAELLRPEVAAAL